MVGKTMHTVLSESSWQQTFLPFITICSSLASKFILYPTLFKSNLLLTSWTSTTYNLFPRPVSTSLSLMASSCANCNNIFRKKPDNLGYFRFSLENIVHHSSQTARDVLSQLTGADFTPIANKSRGQFVCPECWSKFNDTFRYQQSLDKYGKKRKIRHISHKREKVLLAGRSLRREPAIQVPQYR